MTLTFKVVAMYDLGELPEEETALLSVFAVLPAEAISFETLESLSLSSKYENLDEHLLSLAQKGWLEYNENSASFKCSPVIQEITRKKNPKIWENCQALISTLINNLDYEGTHITGSTYEKAALFVRYAETVTSCFAVPEENIAILCERIGSYYQITGDLSQALRYFEDETTLFQELYDAYPTNVGFKNGLAVSYAKLAGIHEALGDPNKMVSY